MKWICLVMLVGCGVEFEPAVVELHPPPLTPILAGVDVADLTFDAGPRPIVDAGTDAGAAVDAGATDAGPCPGTGVHGWPLYFCPSTGQCVDQTCVDCCPVCTDAGCTP
jgi:hypothetical protein